MEANSLLRRLTVNQLISLLRDNGIHGYSGKRKDELVMMAEKAELTPAPVVTPKVTLISPKLVSPPLETPVIPPLETPRDIVLRHQIGKGAFGTVYLGYRKNAPAIPLAVKIINKASLTKSNYQRTERELNILQRLDCVHKNILCVDERIETDTQIMIISEYIPGGISLRQYVVKMKTPEEKLISLDILYQLVDGLGYMHEHDVVHRDIKPANIMMKGHIPIYIDYDLACVEDSDIYKCSGQVGTPNYMAPEVWQKKVHNWEATDIYSLGVTAFYMFNNHQTPYRASSIEELEHQVLNFPPDRSRSEIPALNDLIMKMMTRNPVDRPTTKEIKTHIRAIMKGV